MKPDFNKNFKKQYQKLKPAQKKRFAQALELFVASPSHPALYNHPLSGKWQGHRSISFGGDWRAHYKITGRDTVLFVAVGSHNQLYE